MFITFVKEYKDTENIPTVGENMGRPRDPPLSEHEKEIIRETKKKYRLGARRLELLIDRDYNVHIPHNRIHRYLLGVGLAQSNAKKQKVGKMFSSDEQKPYFARLNTKENIL